MSISNKTVLLENVFFRKYLHRPLLRREQEKRLVRAFCRSVHLAHSGQCLAARPLTRDKVVRRTLMIREDSGEREGREEQEERRKKRPGNPGGDKTGEGKRAGGAEGVTRAGFRY